ncbi:MAG: hypothetical protein REU00_05665, partial [Pseudomonadota bacterium]|nr:hypothetical protein [Pseudomonadota bacterium]
MTLKLRKKGSRNIIARTREFTCGPLMIELQYAVDKSASRDLDGRLRDTPAARCSAAITICIILGQVVCAWAS